MLAGDGIGRTFGARVKHVGSFDQFLSMGHGDTSTSFHALLPMVRILLRQTMHGYLMFGRPFKLAKLSPIEMRQHDPIQQAIDRGFAVGMVVATVLTVMGTFYVLHRFVLDNPADPLTRAGAPRPGQTVK
jgi:hypothetical protein